MASTCTEKDVATLKEIYSVANTDEERKAAVHNLASTLGRSDRAVISKLSNLGIYVKPAPTTKVGGPITAKREYVSAIRIMLGAPDGRLLSLEKASKQDLEELQSLLTSASERVNVSQGK